MGSRAGRDSGTVRRHGIRHGLRAVALHARHAPPARHREAGRVGHE
jgi:hypothetical protein